MYWKSLSLRIISTTVTALLNLSSSSLAFFSASAFSLASFSAFSLASFSAFSLASASSSALLLSSCATSVVTVSLVLAELLVWESFPQATKDTVVKAIKAPINNFYITKPPCLLE